MTEIIANPQADDAAPPPVMRVENAGYVEATPLVSQYRVLKAVILREISQRNGQYRLGYLVSLFMPVAGIAVLMVMFGLKGKVLPSSLPFAVFMITGYPLWQGFSGTYSKVLGTSSKSDPLLMFPQITQLDLIIANVILEFATNTVVFFILCVGVTILFHTPLPDDPLNVLFCFWGCTWIGAALGMILCGLQRVAPLAMQFINMFLRMGMWFSGVIYTINRLPTWLWPYLQWNPILHLIEGCRTSWSSSFDAPIYDPAYVITVGFVMTTLGFVVERLTRRLGV